MEQILLAYLPPKETVTAPMMLYKTTKAMNDSFAGESDFNIVARQYTCAIYVHNLPRLYALNVNRSNKRNGITLKKGKKQMMFYRN